jgi:PKD repeat protein
MESNSFNVARLIGPVDRLRRAARLAVVGGLALALTACGGGSSGGGGGGDSNAAPTAAITATPTSGKAPLTVALDGSGSRDSDGTIASYTWSFSDGSPSLTGVAVSKTFTTAGNVTVTLTVADNRGATGTATRGISVTANAAPTATFTATPISGRAPLLVSFDASGSRDTDGTIASYAWTFGDTGTGTGVTPQHTFNTAGTFTATLTVTDNEGGTGTFSRVITVAPPIGSVSVTVKDTNGVGIAGAAVVATVGGASRSATTDASGVALVTEVLVGTGTVAVSRETFVSQSGIPVTVTANTTTSLDVTLERVTKATGGVLTTSDPIAVASPDGKTLEFSIRVVVVNELSEEITGLPASAFSLRACTPDAATTEADCLSGGPNDVAYTVAGPGAAPSFAEIAGDAPQPYAAMLLFDQSGSIARNDPTDARLFSAKGFLTNLGVSDKAAMAAFADGTETDIKIPEQPVTIYPFGSPSFFGRSEATDLFSDIDSLATQEGGGTPLYEALCLTMAFTRDEATPTDPADMRRAVVVFTDGRNEPAVSESKYTCRTLDQAIAASAATDVDIFAVGLSGEVDGLVLATLADAGNGVFLFAEDVTQLIPIYGSLGNLLSGSLTTYRLTYRISTEENGAFQAGRSVRGSLAVNAATNPINLPFVVRIF